MDPKISVLADIDVDGSYVHLVVTGHLTETNQQGLHPLIRQARTLAPCGTVRADLRGVENIEDHAVASLRWAIEHQEGTGPTAAPVEILLPGPAPDHEPGTAPAVEVAA